jgi:hypothetical protein
MQHEENIGSLNKTASYLATYYLLELFLFTHCHVLQIKRALKTRAVPEHGSIEAILGQIGRSVEVFVSLINLCKTHEKVNCIDPAQIQIINTTSL